METTLDTRHPEVGEAAPDVCVARAGAGEPLQLSRLWADGPAVLVFLRHLGCIFCREQIAQLRADAGKFQEIGATVALITVSQPQDLAVYSAEQDLETAFICLSDPEREAYRAYGLQRGTPSELLSPRVFGRGIQAMLHGYFAGMPKGDPTQLPGVFIVDREGIVRFAHRSKDAADTPPNAALFHVLGSLA
jgi:peroxiredoxin